MYNEAINNLLMKLKQAEIRLVTDFGVEKPEKLADLNFQKRFIKARTKLNLDLVYAKNPAIMQSVETMLRGYAALEKELVKNNVKPFPKETWLVEHKETEQDVLVCKTNEQKLNVEKQFGQQYIIYSVEELLNVIDVEIFRFKEKLSNEGLLPSINKYKVKDESRNK